MADETVTLAVIGNKLDNLTEQVAAWRSDQECRLRVVERTCNESEERWRGHADTHKTERGITATVGVVVTAVLSYLQLR